MRLLCTALRAETADISTWTFRDTGGAPVAFQAGQAVTLSLEVDGEVLRRTFSIASSAACGESIEISIKAHSAGRATRWLHGALRPGMTVESTAPHGRFVLPAPGPAGEPRPRLALISAGSGATPLMSMLRTLADLGRGAGAEPGAEVDVAWVHAARTPDSVLFGPELAALQRRMPRLSVAIAVTQPAPGWFGFRGRITRRLMSVMLPDLADRDVFCCGPAGFMDEVRRIHAAEGGERARFRVEHFAAPDVAALALPESVADAGPASPAEGFRVELEAHSFQVQPGETLLEAASRANVVIPCGCGQGLCGTCRLRLRDGAVTMVHAGGLLPEEEAAGWILACSSRPRSDLVLAP